MAGKNPCCGIIPGYFPGRFSAFWAARFRVKQWKSFLRMDALLLPGPNMIQRYFFGILTAANESGCLQGTAAKAFGPSFFHRTEAGSSLPEWRNKQWTCGMWPPASSSRHFPVILVRPQAWPFRPMAGTASPGGLTASLRSTTLPGKVKLPAGPTSITRTGYYIRGTVVLTALRKAFVIFILFEGLKLSPLRPSTKNFTPPIFSLDSARKNRRRL